jgi:uncharacterized 2Fe-2S/4Fe-4S cluster protein (DUF4445 family)
VTAGVHHLGIRLDGEGDVAVRRIAFEPGSSLRDLLARTSARVRSGCAGIGACGLCRVRIDAGEGGPPTTAERLHLGDEAIAAGTRLACQITPRDDMDVTVLERARPSPWRTPPAVDYRPAYRVSASIAARDPPLGVAVDLGTTQITVALCDLASGRLLAARSGPNPQGRVGADVIGRLQAAGRTRSAALELRQLAAGAIGGALLAMSQEEGIALAAVGRIAVVGNSAMLTLLCGTAPDALLDPDAWGRGVECALVDAAALRETWNLAPRAAIQIVQPLGGFVGSDLLAGVVRCRLAEERGPALLVDFGTNSEIALWDGARLWVTAAAGGPALEATGIGCGMPAEGGALHRLSRSAGGAWAGEVLEAPPARGVCGSGLVDLLAMLRQGGEVDERGRIAREPLTVDVGGAVFGVSKADVDAIQRAKGAVAAGIEVLCRLARLHPDGLAVVHVAGSFGERLDVENAQRIGLLPVISPSHVRLAGNTAVAGALDLLVSVEAEAALAGVRKAATLVNLSMTEDFEERFLENLYVRPMAAGGGR